MPKYLIERKIPNSGNLNSDELCAIAQKSVGVLRELGPQIQWVNSYVTDNAIYCIYIAPNAGEISEHAKRGGFPADQILEIQNTFDPTTAE
jgi:hypothetical protein